MALLCTIICIYDDQGFPGGSVSKKIWLQCRRCRFDPWFGKISWRRKWQPTLVFLPGKAHRQRRLAGCSPWGGKRVSTTQQLTHHCYDDRGSSTYFSQCIDGQCEYRRAYILLQTDFESWAIHLIQYPSFLTSKICVCVCVLVAQSCLTLRPIDCSLPNSSVHGILQARILEWVAIPFSWGTSRPRYLTQVSRISGRFFTI